MLPENRFAQNGNRVCWLGMTRHQCMLMKWERARLDIVASN